MLTNTSVNILYSVAFFIAIVLPFILYFQAKKIIERRKKEK